MAGRAAGQAQGHASPRPSCRAGRRSPPPAWCFRPAMRGRFGHVLALATGSALAGTEKPRWTGRVSLDRRGHGPRVARASPASSGSPHPSPSASGRSGCCSYPASSGSPHPILRELVGLPFDPGAGAFEEMRPLRSASTPLRAFSAAIVASCPAATVSPPEAEASFRSFATVAGTWAATTRRLDASGPSPPSSRDRSPATMSR